MNEHISEDPLGYIRYLDRANQIKALIFSNNKTVNLADTMNRSRIGAILTSTARTSYYAQCLSTAKFHLFSEIFLQEAGLRKIQIRKFVSTNQRDAFYVARIQTMHNNSIRVRSCTIKGVIAALSEKTLRDLVTIEFGSPYKGAAQKLLRISSRLSSISAIMDMSFIPRHHLEIHSKSQTGKGLQDDSL